MKRIVALVLSLALAFAISGICYAEDTYQGYTMNEWHAIFSEKGFFEICETDDYLYMFLRIIMIEIANRNELKSFTAPMGTWIAGTDFPCGRYEIKPTIDFSRIYIFKSGNTATSSSHANVSEQVNSKDKTDSVVYDFQEGDRLVVLYEAVIVTPFTGLTFD